MNRYQAFPYRVAKLGMALVLVVAVQGVVALRLPGLAYFDLPLIYSVYYGFTAAKPVGSIALGSVLGLMQDSLSGVALGMNGFAKTVIAFLAAVAGFRFDVDQTITRVAALVLFTVLDSVLKILLGLLVRPAPGETYGWSLGALVLAAGFNTLIGLVLFEYRSRFGNEHATA